MKKSPNFISDIPQTNDGTVHNIQSSYAMNSEIIKDIYLKYKKLEDSRYRYTMKTIKFLLAFVAWFIFWQLYFSFKFMGISPEAIQAHMEIFQKNHGSIFMLSMLVPMIAGFFILERRNESVFFSAIKRKFKIHPFLSRQEHLKRYLAANYAVANSSYVPNYKLYGYTSDPERIYQIYLNEGIGGLNYNLKKMCADVYSNVPKQMNIDTQVDKQLKDDIEDIFKDAYFKKK